MRVRTVIRDRLGEPGLDSARIAGAAHISSRYLYEILGDIGTTPMRLVKELRLEECMRNLQDPATAERTIKEIAAAAGYRRQDQFAHDFRQRFGISATRARSR
jgi:AraC-like DNA-binding protein